ncbi:hypothetical protein ISCGN_020063 [Ixodes scapularis]
MHYSEFPEDRHRSRIPQTGKKPPPSCVYARRPPQEVRSGRVLIRTRSLMHADQRRSSRTVCGSLEGQGSVDRAREELPITPRRVSPLPIVPRPPTQRVPTVKAEETSQTGAYC